METRKIAVINDNVDQVNGILLGKWAKGFQEEDYEDGIIVEASAEHPEIFDKFTWKFVSMSNGKFQLLPSLSERYKPRPNREEASREMASLEITVKRPSYLAGKVRLVPRPN